MQISPLVQAMPRSGIREIGELAARHPGTIQLQIGEPDADTARHIVDAAYRAARDGLTHYAPNAGIPELREAVADKIRTINRIRAAADDIVITHGAVEGIFSVLAAILLPGDEVLVPDPGWPNYKMMATALSASALGYRIDASTGQFTTAELEARLSPRTRAIIVNTPSNPLGTVLSKATLIELHAFAERHDLWIISDEVYDQLLFGSEPLSVGSLEDCPTRVVSVFSFSKTYAMTGWRIGYVVVPPALRPSFTKLQEPIISCVGTPTQYAALAALTGPQSFVTDSVAEYAARAELARTTLTSAGVASTEPKGAFYLWVDLGASDSVTTARLLASDHGVAVAPGQTFGDQGRHAIRISTSVTRDMLSEGIDRLLGSGVFQSGVRQ